MSFDKEEQNDFLITSGDVDSSSSVPGMLELAVEYFQKEDPESTAMAYLQSGKKSEEPWAVVMAADPESLLRLVMEIIDQHCPDMTMSMIDAPDSGEDDDDDDEFEIDLDELFGDD
tara:strand:+ start:861 stop:1208 length:348 start_codon:yes stop_codon:yes gene_type:complete